MPQIYVSLPEALTSMLYDDARKEGITSSGMIRKIVKKHYGGSEDGNEQQE